MENNYKVGEIQLPIRSQLSHFTPGNGFIVTFMANPYEENESYYVVSSVLGSKQSSEEPGVVKQFQEHAKRRRKYETNQQLQGKRNKRKRK